MKKMKALVLILAFIVLFIGAFTIVSPDQVQAKRCCWVMVCTIDPPMICWEICVPCPTFP